MGRAGSGCARRRFYWSSRGRGRSRLCLSESGAISAVRSHGVGRVDAGQHRNLRHRLQGRRGTAAQAHSSAAFRKDSCCVRQASILEPDVAGDASAAGALQDIRAGCRGIRDGIGSLPGGDLLRQHYYLILEAVLVGLVVWLVMRRKKKKKVLLAKGS